MKNPVLPLLFFFWSAASLSHPNHSEKIPAVAKCASECTEAEVRSAVPKALETLVALRDLPAKWKTIGKVESVALKDFANGQDWVVTLLDPSESDLAKQTLYLFIKKNGRLSGRGYNHTGK